MAPIDFHAVCARPGPSRCKAGSAWAGRWIAVTIVAAASSLTQGSVPAWSAPASPPPAAGAHDLREQVRELAKPRCGSCHQGSVSTAKPAALAVFDLDTADWSARMAPRQFDAFMGRMKGKVEGADLQRVRDFVAAGRAGR
jgi:mono/diheme cytochrome c family protein